MSSTPSIDGDTLDEARNAYRRGISLARLAPQLNCEETQLPTLLGLPQWTAQFVMTDANRHLDPWWGES